MAPDTSARDAIRTRFSLGPLLILIVTGIFFLDRGVFGGRVSAVVLALLGLGALSEYVSMMKGAGFPVGRRILMTAALLLHAMPFFFTSWESVDSELYPAVLVTLGLLFLLSVRALARTQMPKGLEEMGSTLLGFLLVSLPLYLGQGLALRYLPALFFVVLVAKGGDTGGFLAGLAFGRKKLIPHVSPAKSLEGAMGSLLFSVVLVWLLQGPLLRGANVHLGHWEILWVGVLINATTQIGDLVESLLKRRCGVKDSSSLLPVHGGILDIVDSLLFSVPVFFFLFLRWT